MRQHPNCPGCESKGIQPHTPDCLFEHFLCYRNYTDYPEVLKTALKVAYQDGMREGVKMVFKEIRRDE